VGGGGTSFNLLRAGGGGDTAVNTTNIQFNGTTVVLLAALHTHGHQPQAKSRGQTDQTYQVTRVTHSQ
jgi:hypothetical protein